MVEVLTGMAAQPQIYRVVVEGELPRSMDLALDDVKLHRLDGITTIEARVDDQVQLYSLLRRLGELALTLVALTRVT